MPDILLTRGKKTVVDEDIFQLWGALNWHASGKEPWVYARRTFLSPRRGVWLTSLILPDVEGYLVDHINGDTLDNRRSNLRYATPSQNMQNQRRPASKKLFKGVFRTSRKYKNKEYVYWKARIGVNGIELHLGNFSTPEEAARAYNAAAIRYFGVFASLNSLPENLTICDA